MTRDSRLDGAALLLRVQEGLPKPPPNERSHFHLNMSDLTVLGKDTCRAVPFPFERICCQLRRYSQQPFSALIHEGITTGTKQYRRQMIEPSQR